MSYALLPPQIRARHPSSLCLLKQMVFISETVTLHSLNPLSSGKLGLLTIFLVFPLKKNGKNKFETLKSFPLRTLVKYFPSFSPIFLP